MQTGPFPPVRFGRAPDVRRSPPVVWRRPRRFEFLGNGAGGRILGGAFTAIAGCSCQNAAYRAGEHLMRYAVTTCSVVMLSVCGRGQDASTTALSAGPAGGADLGRRSLVQKHSEAYTINGTEVPKDQFGKFLGSLHNRTSESCEKRADGGRTSFYAVDAQLNRYEISHDVTYTRNSAGEVENSIHRHTIQQLKK